MLADDVLFYADIPKNHFGQIVQRAVRYAVISIPFTFNRIGIDDLPKKIINIAKGKIAELMFQYFCVKNGIDADFQTCQTPFYQPDKRDFLWKGKEWDIKNNFLYHQGSRLAASEYVQLPALIPNHHQSDQWQKRSHTYFGASNQTAFLFTFLKNGNHYPESLISVALTPHQQAYLLRLYEQYGGKAQTQEPFTEKDFWHECQPVEIRLYHQPTLVITGYATEAQWQLFDDSGHRPTSYLNGVLRTVINNRTCPIERLPPFRELIITSNNIGH